MQLLLFDCSYGFSRGVLEVQAPKLPEPTVAAGPKIEGPWADVGGEIGEE